MAFVVRDWNHSLGRAICEACGIDPTTVKRVVLDLDVGKPGVLYLETYASEAVLEIKLDAGVEIEEAVS